jgi:hypothetical protein
MSDEDVEWILKHCPDRRDQFIQYCCGKNMLDHVKKICSEPDFNIDWITVNGSNSVSGIFHECYYLKVETVEYLLSLISDPIDISCLNIKFWIDNDDMVKITKLLLDYDNFDKPVLPTDKLIEPRFKKYNALKTLLDEYHFRIDGPEYNKNILT